MNHTISEHAAMSVKLASHSVQFELLTLERAAEDGESIVALGSDNIWENWNVTNLLAEKPHKWELSQLALIDDRPAGYAVASLQDKSVHLHHLVVGSRWRNAGIGAELLRRLILKAKDTGNERLTLKVYEENQRALKFYERYGFGLAETQGELLLMTARLGVLLEGPLFASSTLKPKDVK